MPYAVLTIDKIDKTEPNYMHFKDKSQKAWNCTVPELIANFAEGERYFIDYNESAPKDGRKYGSKYINRARNWKEEDGPNTWPDKEPYQGGGGSSYGGGNKSMAKNDYDPEIGKRQTAANCAMSWCAKNIAAVDELGIMFPAVADIVLKWVDTKGGQPSVSGDGGAASADGKTDEEFGF